MKAYLDSEEVRAKFMGRVWGHYKADEIRKGRYWQGGKGCLVGCMLHSDNHKLAETLIGFPEQIMHLADRIYENLPNAESKELVPAFYDAPKTGADLTLVWPKFAVWLLTDEEWGVLQFAKTEAAKKSIVDVADAYKRVIVGQKVTREEWLNLWKAAAYAASSSYYAAYYASSASFCAADARESHYRPQSKKLLSLMKAA